LFYGSTELNSRDRANTFRLTSTTGLFDFTSFNLQDLEPYVDDYTATSIPTINITSSTGFSQTFSATLETMEFDFDGEIFVFYNYFFMDAGVKEMDWLGVEWVDFTTQYTKAKTSDFVMTLNDFSAGTISLTANSSTVGEVSGTAAVNISGANVTIAEMSGGTVNVDGADATIESYNGGTVAVGDGLAVTIQDGTSSGVISGDGGLIKDSSGVLTLDGVNTYAGSTTVNAGRLIIGAGGSIAGSSEIIVASGATLDLSAVGGLTVGAGNSIAGGGLLLGDLSFADGANFVFSLSNPLTVENGAVSFANFSFANLIGFDASVDVGTYTLIRGIGSTTFDFKNISNLGSGNPFNLGGGKTAYFKEGSLQVVVVPEPGTWVLITIGLSVVLMRRKLRALKG
jgi:autotransporter-associated beta strand protein